MTLVPSPIPNYPFGAANDRTVGRHNGVALLLVLAVLVITVPVAVIVVRQTFVNGLSHATLQAANQTDELRAILETDFIETWLLDLSAKVVLSSSSKIPALNLLDEQWPMQITQGGEPVRCGIRVTAFDQTGMVPLERARPGSPLRLAIPVTLLAQLDRKNIYRGLSSDRQKSPSFGLDQFSSLDSAGFSSSDSQSPFPNHDLDGTAELTLGSYVATHGRFSTAHQDQLKQPSRIPMDLNINTAPIALIESALRFEGRGGIDFIAKARSELKSASTNARANLPQASRPSVNDLHITFSQASSCWAFRIDIEVSGVKRAWWCIYQKVPVEHRRRSGDTNPWECIQRLAINN